MSGTLWRFYLNTFCSEFFMNFLYFWLKTADGSKSLFLKYTENLLKIQSKFHERKHPQEKSIIPGNELFLECMLYSQYWLAAEINRIWVFLHRPLYQGWIEWIMYYTVHIQRCTFYGTRFFSLCCATFPYWKLMFAILLAKLKITCLSTNSPQIPVRKISFTTHEKQKSNEGNKPIRQSANKHAWWNIIECFQAQSGLSLRTMTNSIRPTLSSSVIFLIH